MIIIITNIIQHQPTWFFLLFRNFINFVIALTISTFHPTWQKRDVGWNVGLVCSGLSVWMDKVFLKKLEVTRFIGRLFSLTTIEGQSKEWVNINREYFRKSYKKVFNCLIISLGSKSTFNWSNTLHFFKKNKRLKIKNNCWKDLLRPL